MLKSQFISYQIHNVVEFMLLARKKYILHEKSDSSKKLVPFSVGISLAVTMLETFRSQGGGDQLTGSDSGVRGAGWWGQAQCLGGEMGVFGQGKRFGQEC